MAKEDMEKARDEGMRVLDRIEKALVTLTEVVGNAHGLGMMDLCEAHGIVNEIHSIRYQVLGVHCRLTHVCQKNEVDVPPPPPGPVPLGGGGR